MTDAFSSGTLVGAGSFRCEGCGFALALRERDPLPECPECGGASFRRALLFEPDEHHADHHQVTGAPGWLSCGARRNRGGRRLPGLRRRGRGRGREPWSRAGRASAAACRRDLRFDDPTVSRRHALVYREPDGGARILDDRSLNGVFLNGERVELAELGDGDEIAIGRFTLFFLRAADPPPRDGSAPTHPALAS